MFLPSRKTSPTSKREARHRTSPISKAAIEWDLQHGENLEYYLEIEADTGHTPEPLLARPDVPEHLQTTYQAFYLLSSGRSAGFGTLNPIGTADALALAREIDPDPVRFLRVIRAVDALFLKRLAERQKRETDAKSKAAGAGRRKHR